MTTLTLTSVLIVVGFLTNSVDALNFRPIIGVLAQETGSSDKQLGDSYIISSYVRFLQSAGARVVPIRIKESQSYYEELFKSLNGLLLPGGEIDIVTSYHARAAKIFYDLAIDANDHGDPFVIWGTCQGMQLLSALTAGENLLADRPYFGNLPVDFLPDYKTSRLFRNMPQNIVEAMVKENITANQHNYGLTILNFTNSDRLSNFYTVLSTNFDKNGRQFISSMEAKKYPFFGVQFHPEKNEFNWSLQTNSNHSADAILMTQYFSNFVVGQSRNSQHKFPDVDSEILSLIDNYSPHYAKDQSFRSTYYFNF